MKTPEKGYYPILNGELQEGFAESPRLLGEISCEADGLALRGRRGHVRQVSAAAAPNGDGP